ncbi:flagellar basal body P-ring biosynthesis protein FlgA [Methylophaga muralis]|uniref:Flagella basal body P-ring formation protein FlgA n=1 Tax=Methylophaga muralis TaxID=291169 RepID=A0A1E3GR92_9GAMM|nr:flagellar basal body P-ring biosynthesis protein FlgA [Methylophaga muralis]
MFIALPCELPGETMYKLFRNLILVLSVNLLTFTASASNLQSLAEVEHAAYVFTLAQAQARFNNPEITLTPLDKRLRLQNCGGGLEAFTNRDLTSAGNVTVGVRCHQPVSWTVYLPLQIKVMQPMVVIARPVSANHVLTEQDLRIEQRDIGNLRQGYMASIAAVVGQQVKYSLGLGTVIQANHLRPLNVVRRGESIVLVASAGTMEVRMQGTAMADAGVGDRVRVRNLSSDRVVEGIVDSPGVVRVTM